MLNPFIDLIGTVLQLYTYAVIIWTVMSVLISFSIINAYQPFVRKVMHTLNRLCEPALKPIRKFLPDLGGIDFSPLVLILLLNFVRNALYAYLYNL